MKQYLVRIRGTQSVDVFSSSTCYEVGDEVCVRSERGLEIGKVVKPMIEVDVIGEIERKATAKDVEVYWDNLKDAQKAQTICEQKIKTLNLNMSLIAVSYNLDKSKIFIDYMAKERVDFRELLKELSKELKTRIELKQLGIRDCARALGGIGSCGLTLCCTFKKEFKSVTISMAKNQMIPINNDALTGMCGKLKCCLAYENDLYTECRSRFPKIKSKVTYMDQVYTVVDINCCANRLVLSNHAERINLSLDEFNQTGVDQNETTEL